MKLLSCFFIVCVFSSCFAAMTDLKEYNEKIENIYKNPSSSTTEKLLMYAFFYLDELFKLEECVEEAKDECKEFLRKFHDEGGPQHLDNIPWGKFIEEWNWKGTDVSEYENVIDKSKRSWSDLLKMLNEISHSGDET